MASGPITSWQIDWDTVADFIFLDSKITADGDCSHEIRWLLLSRKVMTNIDSVLKSRDITLPSVPIVKVMVFQWSHTPKIDAFKLWCWRRLLKVPWTARRANYSILRESTLNTHWKDCCWSWNSSILVTWCQQPTHWKSPWWWERLRAEGEEGIRGWDGWTAWCNEHELGQTLGDGEGQRGLACWHAAVHGITKTCIQVDDWTTKTVNIYINRYRYTHI